MSVFFPLLNSLCALSYHLPFATISKGHKETLIVQVSIVSSPSSASPVCRDVSPRVAMRPLGYSTSCRWDVISLQCQASAQGIAAHSAPRLFSLSQARAKRRPLLDINATTLTVFLEMSACICCNVLRCLCFCRLSTMRSLKRIKQEMESCTHSRTHMEVLSDIHTSPHLLAYCFSIMYYY